MTTAKRKEKLFVVYFKFSAVLTNYYREKCEMKEKERGISQDSVHSDRIM